MNLSDHFLLAEFLRSETAARHGLDMQPPGPVLYNLRRLATLVLEPIRARALRPIVITSGYRPPALNELVRGSKTSDHMLGRAADIHAVGISLDELGAVIRSVAPGIPLKQAIAEFGQWWHVSVQDEAEQPRREFLAARIENGQTVYSHA
jgi:zinc D-Ala-D-Ala carboxypeptidase